ncbi:DivIVA domain-containing protein [Arcanobacterium hippocoleae]
MSENEQLFPVVMRGYDRTQVDAKVSQLQQTLETTRAQVTHLDSQILQLSAELAQAHEAAREQERPSYSGLGTRVERLLRSAEEQALDVMTRARKEAAEIIAHAQVKAAQLHNSADLESEK